jgi:diguanylate cyclase
MNTASKAGTPVAQLAKGALRRLALAQREPTPENYARAFAEEAGEAPPPPAPIPAPAPVPVTAMPSPATDGAAWAGLIERIARQLERPGQQWTPARRKDSLQRVLTGSRSDASRLLQRLQGLTSAWEADRPAEALDLSPDPGAAGVSAPHSAPATGPQSADLSAHRPAGDPAGTIASPNRYSPWPTAASALHAGIRAGLAAGDPRADALAAALADEMAALADSLATEPVQAAHLATLQQLCARAQRFFAHRHHLIDELGALCRELAAGLTDLAEDESWARGQCASLQARLGEAAADAPGGPSVRSVRAATELLAETRARQVRVRSERQSAQAAIKTLIQRMISEAGDLGDHAGRFQHSLTGHAQAIAGADSLASLAGVVQAMLDDSRAVQSAVNASRDRLQGDQAQAQGLQQRVRELESELRRLSDEVATDALTQVANRRGLMQAFDTLVGSGERSQHAGQAPLLAVGLLDIDNFKKLNDTLGHAAGDQALKALASAVRERLRPVDHLARFGGEEFVVLLPGSPLPEAQQALTRLQRGLSQGLFMHDGKEVFVTFSAGVTAWQPGEPLEAALERADEALYEAKRTGKNRTCTG